MAGMTSGALMAMCAAPAKIASVPGMPKYVRSSSFSVCFSMRPLAAFASVQQEVMDEEDDLGIVCDPCGGKGWILCDFCNGQKTNVKSASNRIYRRCPSCKAGRRSSSGTRCCWVNLKLCLYRASTNLRLH
ncbi:hypothetical protein QQ045_004008 [Rhodiola kirilowii]